MDPEREAVIRQAERSWCDVVETYDAGRDAFIAARLADHDERDFINTHINATTCGPKCPSAPHAHPIDIDDELRNLL